MKHKHYDYIVAWASGESIEVLIAETQEWEIINQPRWYDDNVYRIKREPRWFGLTGSEVRQLKDIHIPMYSTPTTEDWFNFYRAIENELKDKNTTHRLQHDK